MARLSWNQDLYRPYETGIDQGVLYFNNNAIPWNGLVSVTKAPISEPTFTYYFDGIKYFDKKPESSYQITVNALHTPYELNDILGIKELVPGFMLTQQEPTPFNFSYRTNVGDNLGYKLHLVYNAIVSAPNTNYATLSDTTNISSKAFVLKTVPIQFSDINPSAYIVFDSTKMSSEILTFIEDILYGTEDETPRLPNIFELSNIFDNWRPFKVQYNDSGISSLIAEFGDILQTDTDGLFLLVKSQRLKPTSNSNIYRLEF